MISGTTSNVQSSSTTATTSTAVVGSGTQPIPITGRQRTDSSYGKSPSRSSSIGGATAGGAGGVSSDAGTPGGSPVPVVKEKRMAMRAVRSLMRLGRSRQSSQTRDSSTEDEGR